MFVKTVKFTRKKALAIVLAAAVVLAVVVLLVSGGSKGSGGGALRTNADMVSYLSKLGWTVTQEPLETKEVTIPATFDAVLTDYNTLQKQQGFDLAKYAGQQATIYTFQVTNYPVQGDVMATLYVLRGHVIAGDIHSTAIDGFMHGLK